MLALQYFLKSLKTSASLFNLIGHTVPEETIHDSVLHSVRTMVTSQKLYANNFDCFSPSFSQQYTVSLVNLTISLSNMYQSKC